MSFSMRAVAVGLAATLLTTLVGTLRTPQHVALAWQCDGYGGRGADSYPQPPISAPGGLTILLPPGEPASAGGPRTLPGNPTAPVPVPTAPSVRRPGTAATFTRRAPTRVALDGWEAWWEVNGDAYLRAAASNGGRSITGQTTPGREDRFEPPVLPAQFRRMVLPELAQALREGDPQLVSEAALALGRSTPAGDTAPLCRLILPLLEDARRGVRRAAILALGLLGDPQASGALLSIVRDTEAGRRLLGEPEGVCKHCRSLAALSVGLMGSTDHAGELLEALRTTRNSALRAFLVLAAAESSPASTAVLSEVLSLLRDSSEERGVRAQAAAAIAQMGRSVGRAALADLARLLEESETPVEIRLSACIALGRLAEPHDEEVVDLLLRQTQQSGDQRCRQLAWMSLGRLLELDPDPTREEPRRRIVHHLLNAVLRPARGADRPFAALALGIGLRAETSESKHKTLAQQKVREMLRRANQPSELGALALAAGLLRDARCTDHLIDRLADSRLVSLSIPLVQALGLLGDGAAATDLRRLALDEKADAGLRVQATRALALLNDHQVITGLQERVESCRSTQALATYTACLGALRSSPALAPLLGLLRAGGPSPDTRRLAAHAIGYLAETTESSWFLPYTIDSNYFLATSPGALLLEER